MNRAKERRVIFWWILLAIIIFVSFYFDNRIVMLVSLIRTPDLSVFFTAITSTAAIIIFFILLNALFISERKRKFLVPLWVSVALSYVAAVLLKVLIQRQRPFQLGLVSIASSVKESFSSWDFSFPSSHAVLVFAALPFISKEYPRFKYAWIAFACFVAFSRVYLGVHFLSDVIVGAIIGYAIGFLMLRRIEGKL